ncbi:MAG: hypothetical protein V3U10_06420 [Bacteroidota bacterium]
MAEIDERIGQVGIEIVRLSKILFRLIDSTQSKEGSRHLGSAASIRR